MSSSSGSSSSSSTKNDDEIKPTALDTVIVEGSVGYIDGDPDIVEATIDEFGQINVTKVLNSSKAFSTIPEIVVVGGGGAGGFVLPSLVCLPPKQLQERGYVKIGTGSYIDCP